MLNQQPPGYNAPSINRQDVDGSNIPGRQGATAQGYIDPYKSSYAAPSNYSVPSSTNAPNQWYTQQPQQNNNMQAMLQALMQGGHQ